MSLGGSDISSFAEWEALHPPQERENSERERSRADMARPERVWKDRDSSNDARSSSEDDSSSSEQEEVGEKLPVEKAVKGRKEIVIPSSTAETVSQELLVSLL
jgi:hypothetical protein